MARRGHLPAGVVDDLLDDTSDVAISLSEIVVAKTSGVLVEVSMGLENSSGLSLRADDTSPTGVRDVDE